MTRRYKTMFGVLFGLVVLTLGIGTAAVHQAGWQRRMGIALIAAIQKRDAATVKAQLAAGTDANTRDLSHDTRTTWQRLWDRLRGKADAPLLTGLEPTALMVAMGDRENPANETQLRIVNTLLDAGAMLDAKDANGSTVLHYAVETSDVSMLQMLVARGALVKVRNSSGKSPLHWAAYDGRDAIAALLIEKGGDVNARDDGGATPLFDAVIQNQASTVRLLLAKGADVNVRNDGDYTPLALARQNQKNEIITLLTKAGGKE